MIKVIELLTKALKKVSCAFKQVLTFPKTSLYQLTKNSSYMITSVKKNCNSCVPLTKSIPCVLKLNFTKSKTA